MSEPERESETDLGREPAPSPSETESEVLSAHTIDAIGLDQAVRTLLARGATSKDIWPVVLQSTEYHKQLEISAKAFWRKVGDQLKRILSEEDIPSEVTLRLSYRFLKDRPFPWTPDGPFTHWLATVLATGCREVLEYFTRGNRVLKPLGGKDNTLEAPRGNVRLRFAITLLDDPHRTIIEMILFQNMKQTEIAIALGFSEAWVSERAKKAIDMLRQLLGP